MLVWLCSVHGSWMKFEQVRPSTLWAPRLRSHPTIPASAIPSCWRPSNQGNLLQNCVQNACHWTGCCFIDSFEKDLPKAQRQTTAFASTAAPGPLMLFKTWKQQTPQPTAAPSTAVIPTQRWAKRTHGACGLTSCAVEDKPGLNYESSWSVAVMRQILCRVMF